MQLTEKQRQAIDTRGTNVLVSAAAGSGKTFVLTQRIASLVVKDRVPLKKLLVVTFTEAAASEMKSRIAGELAKAAENNPFASAQLRNLDSANITTFHSFCLTIVRRFFFKIDQDPSFGVASAEHAATLREAAADEVIAEAFADEDGGFREAFRDFLFGYSDVRSERSVRDKILKLYEFITTLPDSFDWLRQSVSALSHAGGDMSEAPAVSLAYREIEYRLRLARTLTEETGRLLDSLGLTGLSAKNAIDLQTVTEVGRLFGSGDWDSTKRALENISFERFAAARDEKEVYAGIKDFVGARRARVKGILKDEVRDVFFVRSKQEYADEVACVAPFARTLEVLTERFETAYTRMKDEENIIDFADFEHKALKILEHEDVREDYRRRIEYIFIDEYQDSNYVQEELISRISRGNNVFMVGDVKQSIYGFRNAVPQIFLDKRERYSEEAQDSSASPRQDADGCVSGSGDGGLRIELTQNYRSQPCVINAVNAIFEVIMERHYSGMDYDDSAKLAYGLGGESGGGAKGAGASPPGKACLHLIKKDAGKDVFENDTEGEAALAAGIIQNIAGRPYYDIKNKKQRVFRYGDVAILLKAAAGASDVYKKTLEARGIPVVTDRGEGYFETVEVDTFLGLLRAVINLRRDVPLAAALCSVVFGFELAELAQIRAEEGPDGFFYAAFLSYIENGADEKLRRKCADAAARLSVWQNEERFMRLDDFMWKLMRGSGFYDYAGTLPRGEYRQANLRALLDRARAFQKGRVEGLRGFLAFLDKIKIRGGAEQATLVTEGEDVCRIMSIHGSKGLEFPVVLMGGMGRTLSGGGFRDDSLLFHRDAGLSLYWQNPAEHTYKKTLLHSAIKLRQEMDERAENIRLLYVGMTRAMEELHMIGTSRDPESQIELYGADGVQPAIDTDIMGASNFLQIILPAALKRRDCFDVRIVLPETIPGLPRPLGINSAKELKPAVSEMQAVASVLSAQREEPAAFVYPYAASQNLKSKYSVTELCAPAETYVRPSFFMAGGAGEVYEDAGLTAAERGTAFHKALERLDFAEAYAHRGEREWFETYLAESIEGGALSEAEAGAVSAKTLMTFANSSLAARAAASPFLLKEAPFNMKHSKDGEEIIVQGVIDCLFEEAGGFVLADYKTGFFDEAEYEKEANRICYLYSSQIGMYRRAAELIFGRPVQDSFIYMARTGSIIRV